MSKRAKRHHIVPKTLQKQFAIPPDNKQLWRAKRGTDGSFGSITRKNILKSFVSHDHYTVLLDGTRSDVVEKEFYSKIDNFLGAIIPEMLAILEAGQIPEFSPETLELLRETVMHMAKRTPDFAELQDEVELGKELITEALSLETDPTLIAELTSALNDDAKLKDKGRDIRVRATLTNSQRVKAALSELVPRWAKSETKHSYILSSRMVYRIGNGGRNGLVNPKFEMWFPIHPKYALVLVRDPKRNIPHIVTDSPEHIRKVNKYAVRESHEIASHSHALLRSLFSS